MDSLGLKIYICLVERNMTQYKKHMEQIKSNIISLHAHSRIYAFSALTGIISGLLVVAYRSTITEAETLRERLIGEAPGASIIIIWLGIAVTAAIITALFTRRWPLIKGSGIPQVKAFLMRRVYFSWKQELPSKFAGGALALGAGLSLGREGPSIQLGALAGSALEDIFHLPDCRRYLVTAGAAAGISAAFNAPLAGVLFCIEELHRNFSPVMLTVTMIASFLANAVMWIFFGTDPIFNLTISETLPLNYYFNVILGIGVLTGVLGSLFNIGLLGFQKLYQRLVPREEFRIISAFLVAALVSIVYPQISGGGNTLVSSSFLSSMPFILIAVLLALKFVFTLFSYASGAPGGIFLPMLAIGSIIGGLVYSLLTQFGYHSPYLPNYILLGMAGFFVAVVRAPITGAVLITEMAGSFAHFPAFIFVSIIASLTAGILKTKPIYDSLLAQIHPMHPEQIEHVAITLHIPIMEGSPVHLVSELRERLPSECILAGIMRGEERLFPYPLMELLPGDEVLIEVDQRVAHLLKEDLLKLGMHEEKK
jgi:H+/Cl- antiporter ClcA